MVGVPWEPLVCRGREYFAGEYGLSSPTTGAHSRSRRGALPGFTVRPRAAEYLHEPCRRIRMDQGDVFRREYTRNWDVLPSRVEDPDRAVFCLEIWFHAAKLATRTMLVNGPRKSRRRTLDPRAYSCCPCPNAYRVCRGRVACGHENEPSPTISARGGRFAGGNDVATAAHESSCRPRHCLSTQGFHSRATIASIEAKRCRAPRPRTPRGSCRMARPCQCPLEKPGKEVPVHGGHHRDGVRWIVRVVLLRGAAKIIERRASRWREVKRVGAGHGLFLGRFQLLIIFE